MMTERALRDFEESGAARLGQKMGIGDRGRPASLTPSKFSVVYVRLLCRRRLSIIRLDVDTCNLEVVIDYCGVMRPVNNDPSLQIAPANKLRNERVNL